MIKQSITVSIVCGLLIGHGVYAQVSERRFVDDNATVALQGCIQNMSKRNAVVAYNLANAGTPGFKPIRFPDEVRHLRSIYGGDMSALDTVNIDDEMINATQIRLMHNACIKLLSTKWAITRRIASLGKGG